MSGPYRWLFDEPVGDARQAGEIRAAQMASFARQTPINALVTLAASGLTAGVLWLEADRGWVAAWAGAHLLIAATVLVRWWSHRGVPAKSWVSERGPRRAKVFAWAAGAAWGAGVGFLPFVPPPQQIALIIVTAAMGGGASTTLAALPGAAAGFIVFSIMPYAGYFVAQNDPVYFALAAMALVMTLAMLGSTRIAYSALLEEIKTRQANTALLDQFQSERRQWLDISDTADAFALFDDQDRLLLWNRNYGQILSLPDGLLQRGAPRSEILRQSARPVDVRDESDLTAWIDGRSAAAGRDGGEDVRRFTNDRWIRSQVRRTEDGHTVTIHTDITAIKQAEQRASRLAAIVDSTADAVIGLDPDGIVTSWNEAATRIYGYGSDEIVGKSVALLPPADRLDEVTDILTRVKRGERISNQETVRRTKGGLLVNVSLTASPVYDDAGAIVGVSAIYRDITEQKHTENQLRQAQKMETVGQLTGGVAHDFNTLLGVLIGNLEMLQDKDGIDADSADLIASAMLAATRGVDLTSRLLAFSRKQNLRPRVTDLNERVTETISLLNRTLDTNIQIRTLLSGRLWHTLIDPTQMETAIMNLALNARSAMPEGGILTISTANVTVGEDDKDRPEELAPGQYVMLSVADSGTGMSQDVLAQAFEPFFTTRDIGQGSGLGLSMVHGFVKQSGGHIRIASAAGTGTTVTVWFPRTTQPMTRRAPAERPAPPPTGAGETILVVEDDSSLRRVAETMLQSLGYTVITASDGNSALTMLEQNPTIDLLFTDLALPRGMDGTVLARKAADRRPDLRILFTSGFAEYAGRRYDMLDDDVTLIAKPYRKAALARHVRQILDEQPLGRDARQS